MVNFKHAGRESSNLSPGILASELRHKRNRELTDFTLIKLRWTLIDTLLLNWTRVTVDITKLFQVFRAMYKSLFYLEICQ